MDEDMRVIDGVDKKYFYRKNMDGCWYCFCNKTELEVGGIFFIEKGVGMEE